MTKMLQIVGNWFKTEFKTENDDFKNIAIKSSIIGILLALSILWVGFSYLALIVAILAVIIKPNGRTLYYIVFLLPLITIFKAQSSDFYYLAYIVFAACLALAIKLIFDIFKYKDKKINWPFTAIAVVLGLYFIARANFSNISILLSLLLGLGLLFVTYYYKKDLNFKEVIFMFVLGMLFSTLIGLIFYKNSRLISFLDITIAYSRRRFQGATSNVNIYACELMLALGGLLVLKLRNQISYSLYPILVFFCGCLMFTYSKTAILMSIVAITLFVLFNIGYNLKNRKKLLKALVSVAVIVVMLSLLCVTFKTQYAICRARFVSSIDMVIPEPDTPMGGSDVASSLSGTNSSSVKPTIKLDYTELTTGRFDIWKTYMQQITQTPKTLLFGFGVGHEIDSEWVMYTGTSTHNTLIQAMYYCGIMGLILMAMLFIFSLDWKNFKIKNYSLCGIIMLIITAIFLMGLDFFSFRLGVYLLICFYALVGVKNQEDSQLINSSNEIKKVEKTKVLNVLASNKYSGAENVVCQIIDVFGDEYEFAYCSPDGPIKDSLKERNIKFLPLNKKSIKELKRVIKEYSPDIIHAHDVMAITMCALATRTVPIVAHIHNKHVDFKKISIRSLIFRVIAGQKNVKSIIWVAQSSFDDYIYKNHKKIKDKSVIQNNIINRSKLQSIADSAELRTGTDLVYLGRLAYPKNPERLIRICALVKDQIPDVTISIIGDGNLKETCEHLAKELGVDKNITFYGFQSNGYKIVENSKIFVMTSETEGNPMCILEAQAFGLPIVTTAINELKTLVYEGQTGYMYNTDQEAADIIIELLNNKKVYSSIKETIKAFSEEYNNIEKYKQVLRKIYNS